MDWQALGREAVRLSRRYQVEVVEHFNLCPWAQRARQSGDVTEFVLFSDVPDHRATLEALGEIDRTGCSIGLILLPCLQIDSLGFGHFVSELSETARSEPGSPSTRFALAAFHPEAEADLGHPDRLVPFLRRTPDPTIQVVRQSALDAVREGFSDGTHFVDIHALGSLNLTAEDTLPLRDRIARANHRTVRRVGLESLQARVDSILRDRATTYAALGIGQRS